MPRVATTRRAGVTKPRHGRVDRDGDLVMGAVPETPANRRPPNAPAAMRGRNATSQPRPGGPTRSHPSERPGAAPRSSRSAPLAELKVTGWTDHAERAIEDLVLFLDRHAGKRNPRLRAQPRSLPPVRLIRKHRVDGDALYIRVLEEDASAFGKINNFTYLGDKLTITGPGIRSRDTPVEGEKTKDDQTPKTRELLQGVLNRRYNAESKLLDLSALGTDPDLNAIGMFSSPSTQSKFFPALMKVCDSQFESAQQKRDTVHSVTLANNDLVDISIVTTLAQTFPHLLNLDLSANKFQSTKDLIGWKNKFRYLDMLVLDSNPILLAQLGWEVEIISWFPRLRLLNGVQVRTPEEVAALDRPKETPVPATQGVWNDSEGIAERFVLDFFATFDADRNAALDKYYDGRSTFSFSVNANAKGGTNQHDRTPWDAYIKGSRNIKFVKSPRVRYLRNHRGPAQIRAAWESLPPTRHPSFATENHKYTFDCQAQGGLPDITGQYPSVYGFMINIHGEYEEHHTTRGANDIVRRCFDRAFVIGPGGKSGVRIHSDMLSLRAYGGTPAWQPQGADVTNPSTTAVAPVPTPTPIIPQSVPVNPTAIPTPDMATNGDVAFTAEQVQMLMEVQRSTGMNLEFSKQCLVASNWNMAAAATLFEAQKGNLGPEAFS